MSVLIPRVDFLLKIFIRGALATFATNGSCPSLIRRVVSVSNTPSSHRILRSVPWHQTTPTNAGIELSHAFLPRYFDVDGHLFR